MGNGISTFNIQDGFSEAIVRGNRQALLTPDDYRKLAMSETLEDLRSALEDTDYGGFLQDEPTPLAVSTISTKCREKFADEFRNLQAQANSQLNRFLDFIVAEKMIDNVVSLIQGALNRKSPEEMLARADPLGWTNELKALLTLDASAGYEDLYRMVLVDTPVGRYFEEYLSQQESDSSGGQQVRNVNEVEQVFSELDLEVMRASLKKAWLEDFYEFCKSLGGITAEVMTHILMSQADFLVLAVTLNSLNAPMGGATQLSDKNSLFPAFGYLYPSGTDALRKAYNDATIRLALEPYGLYAEIYEQCRAYYAKDQDVVNIETNKDQLSLEDAVYRHEVKMYELAHEQQMHYGSFYSWIKLKEQEIRNILWIADMILMQRRDQMDQVLPIFAARY